MKIMVLIGLLMISCSVSATERPTIDKFFAGQRIQNVSISPDGRYLALTITSDGYHYLGVIDRQQKSGVKPLMRLEKKEHTSFRWCKWAKADRVLCSILLSTNVLPSKTNLIGGASIYYGTTRIVAVDADGKSEKILVDSKYAYGGQFQDRIIDWLRDDPDDVLIELQGYVGAVGSGYGAIEVKRLNIRTGTTTLVESGKLHVAGFATDGRGNVRLASGIDDTTFRMYARPKDSDKWNEIVKRKIVLKDESQYLDPQFVIPGTNDAYAIGDYKGYDALWSVSLTGKSEPEMLYAESGADVYSILGPDRQLLGVRYDKDKPGVTYFNSSAQFLQDAADKLFPGHINQLEDFSRDLKTVVIRTQSDQDPASFYVLDTSVRPAILEKVGSMYPGLKGFALAKVEPVSFPASDGTMVPAYLTRPAGAVDLAKTPLIVLPHGGAYARDRWGFNSWVQYLASHGYAVLQIEFRGSTGYGSNWFKQGFADWGGKPYSDVVDGAKWALSKGYGDPSRTCIVGASFGGYMALLAATLNKESKLFKCAVSISGVSDLRQFLKDRQWFDGYQLAKQSIGTDREKLKEDSPRMHAADVNIPVLLIHGDEDYTVEVDESKLMDKALTEVDKPHELVLVKGADHYYRDDAYLKEMFTSMSDFLSKQIGAN